MANVKLKGKVICKLPKAGLGNQLFPLMKAFTFGHLNALPVTVTNYHQLKIGPYIRGEKTKRNYTGFFTFQKAFLPALIDEWAVKLTRRKIETEPVLQIINDESAAKNFLYVYTEMPHWDHYFDGLKDHRYLVRQLLQNLLTKKITDTVQNLAAPCIGVHIRMGDFRKLKEGEDFSKVGIVRTPESYFVETIEAIRKIHGTDLAVSVFTDGFFHEFDQLFKLKNVTLVEGNSDLVDLLLLSKSKIIVTSASSTFSYWAAFLSEAVILLHPDHTATSIRSSNDNTELFEGAFDDENPLLISNIRQVSPDC